MNARNLFFALCFVLLASCQGSVETQTSGSIVQLGGQSFRILSIAVPDVEEPSILTGPGKLIATTPLGLDREVNFSFKWTPVFFDTLTIHSFTDNKLENGSSVSLTQVEGNIDIRSDGPSNEDIPVYLFPNKVGTEVSISIDIHADASHGVLWVDGTEIGEFALGGSPQGSYWGIELEHNSTVRNLKRGPAEEHHNH